MRTTTLGLLAAGMLLIGAGPPAATATPLAPVAPVAPSDLLWTGTWAASHTKAASFGANWSIGGFDDQTVRQVVRISTGGIGVRIRLSNVFGSTPLRVAGAAIARTASGAAVRPGTSHRLTFGFAGSVVIPAGGEVASDLALLTTSPLESLTVSLYFAEPTGPATFHSFALATSYRASGDRRSDTGASAYTETSTSWYYLAGVDVLGLLPRDAVVTLGDSITDGAHSTPDANNRYSDELAERLVAAGTQRGVLNAGIGGNRVLNDSECFGVAALARLGRDVLDEPRASAVIVLEGINDIRASAVETPCLEPNPEVTVQDLIAGHREIIRRARACGITAIGATLLPYKGDSLYTERGEQVREALNTWIRTSGEYDAVADFDRALADPADPDRLRAEYDSGDHLHPERRGHARHGQRGRPRHDLAPVLVR
jgi:lysophospholipase L1-like esterase